MLYRVLFGGEVVLTSHLEAVVSVQNGGYLQRGHVMDEIGQLLAGQATGLCLEVTQLGLSLSYVLSVC